MRGLPYDIYIWCVQPWHIERSVMTREQYTELADSWFCNFASLHHSSMTNWSHRKNNAREKARDLLHIFCKGYRSQFWLARRLQTVVVQTEENMSTSSHYLGYSARWSCHELYNCFSFPLITSIIGVKHLIVPLWCSHNGVWSEATSKQKRALRLQYIRN